MEIAHSYSDLVGNTPLFDFSKMSRSGCRILGKLEWYNPGMSVKDRAAVAMLRHAEDTGALKKGGTLIEPSSGNTAFALASLAAERGYAMIAVVPKSTSIEKKRALEALGANIIETEELPYDHPESHYQVAFRLARERDGAVCLNQYANERNPLAHYHGTGPEILAACPQVTHFVAGMGTGGTLSGTARYLREKRPGVCIVAADPEGSVFHHLFEGTTPQLHDYHLEGVGEWFHPANANLALIDRFIVMPDSKSIAAIDLVAREFGLLIGGSSGLALAASLALSDELGPTAVVLTLLPDHGRSYLSTIFNPTWRDGKGLPASRDLSSLK